MNKGQLVDHVAKAAGISKSAADKAINGFIEAIEEAMSAGEKVTLVGFGSFYVSERKARTGRHPKTGEAIQIPARKVVKFKPGSRLMESAS